MKHERIGGSEVASYHPNYQKEKPKPDWIENIKQSVSNDVVKIEIEIPNLIMDCYHIKKNKEGLLLHVGLHLKQNDFRIKDYTLSLDFEMDSNQIKHSVQSNTITILIKRK